MCSCEGITEVCKLLTGASAYPDGQILVLGLAERDGEGRLRVHPHNGHDPKRPIAQASRRCCGVIKDVKANE